MQGVELAAHPPAQRLVHHLVLLDAALAGEIGRAHASAVMVAIVDSSGFDGVEDDEATLSFLMENLSADGFAVAGASGAAEGLRQIEVRHPALVLLDLGLSQGSGLELLDRVRSADGLASRQRGLSGMSLGLTPVKR